MDFIKALRETKPDPAIRVLAAGRLLD